MGTNVYVCSQEYVRHYRDMYTLIDGLCPGEGSPSWGSPRLFRDDNFKCIFLNETV